MSSLHAASSTQTAVSVQPLLTQTSPQNETPPVANVNGRVDEKPSQSEEASAATETTERTSKGVEMPGEEAAGETLAGQSVLAMNGAGNAEGAESSTGDAVGSSEDSQQWSDEDSHELKRVKVYELVGSRWLDQGTAFCFGDFQDNEALLVARAEADFNNVILSTTIHANDVYQRQQDTLIVWTEPDGVDYALSFQDPEGCAEVWHFIQEVQRHMNTGEEPGMSSPLIGPEPSVTTASIIRSGHLPHPALGIIGEIERAIKTIGRTPQLKDRVCEYIQSEDYVKALIDVMHQAEDLESLENLHALCSCMQTILMLNDHTMYEHILEDDIFYGVVGMLEYDPEFPTHKANYREFLRQTSQFHQPIAIRDEGIRRKVHHTYRLQFLKDVVLARAIDDSTFNVLNSCILFNQMDIINHVQNDQAFLRELVGMFMDEATLSTLIAGPKSKEPDKMDVDILELKSNGVMTSTNAGERVYKKLTEEELARHREVVYLIQQLCAMGKNVQLPTRMSLFKTLTERGILFAVEWAFTQSEREEEGQQMIAASGEILTTILDHDLMGVRAHIIKQSGFVEPDVGKNKEQRHSILVVMCGVLVRSRNLAVQSQLGDSLKGLLEITQSDLGDQTVVNGIKLMRPKDEPGIELFLNYFYKYCAEVLFKPFGDIPEFKADSASGPTLSRERTNLFVYLCDLLAICTQQHSFHSHFYVLSANFPIRIATLLSARDKHLRLAAFRFFRAILRVNNSNLFRNLMKNNVFRPILDLTLQESRRDNLLSSSCQEFFEHIRKENVKELIAECMTQYEDKIKTLADSPLSGPVFQAFIRRWEMNNAPPPPPDEPSVTSAVSNGSQRIEGRALSAEEEDYFNADDDDEPLPIVSTPPLSRTYNPNRKRPRSMGQPTRRTPSVYVRSPSLGSLVDYDDGDDSNEIAISSPGRSPSTSSFPPNMTIEIPPSPRMPYRQIPFPTNSPTPEDDEDNLLESLVAKPGERLPPTSDLHLPDFGIGKRRRDDDDDGDELLERLAKSKRPSMPRLVDEKLDLPVAGRAGPTKGTEEGPKKIKLKFGAVGAAVASSSPALLPSSTGAKDGDTG